MGPAKKKLLIFFKLVGKSIDRSIRNVQRNSLPCSSYGLGAISDILIFEKVVFVGNKAIGPMHKQIIMFC